MPGRSAALVVVALVGALLSTTTASAQEAPPPPLPTRELAGDYFVIQQYDDFLGRTPDADGLRYWSDRLDAGLSPGGLIVRLVDSPEFGDVRLPVARLYRAALGRLPDDTGWRYWADRLADGERLESLAAALIATPEGIDRLGADDPDTFVDALYRNVLGRTGDPAGRAFWLTQLDSGRSRASIVAAFATSPEFTIRFDPEIRAAMLYSGLLDRPPESAGLTFWTSALTEGRPYASVIDQFVATDEYRQRLRTRWCRTVTLDDALDWSDEPVDHEIIDPGRVVLHDIAFALAAAFPDGTYPDELTTRIIDDEPRPPRFVIGIHEPALERACLPLLAFLPRPDLVRFAPTPTTTSGLRTIGADIQQVVGPDGWYGMGYGRGRLTVELRPTALEHADEILARYGFAIEELRVGALPFPMPDPLPESVCATEPPDTVDAAALGLEVTVDLPATVVSGDVASGTFTVTNVGADARTIWWGYEVTAYVGSGQTASSTFSGIRFDPLNVRVLQPGDSTSGRLDIGTDACDPADGHRLPTGSYTVWGTIPVVTDAAPDLYPGDEDRHIRLPAVTLTLTD